MLGDGSVVEIVIELQLNRSGIFLKSSLLNKSHCQVKIFFCFLSLFSCFK